MAYKSNLLNILNLLANAFQFFLHANNDLRDLGVV